MTSEYLSIRKSKRLLLRPLRVEDANDFESFFDDSVTNKFLPSHIIHSNERSKAWVERQMQRYRENRGGLLALVDHKSNEFVGMAGLLLQEIEEKIELEIGYHILPTHRGKGFAVEASKFLKQIGFDLTSYSRIVSIIHPNNVISQSVALSNGMIPLFNTVFHRYPAVVYVVERQQTAGMV